MNDLQNRNIKLYAIGIALFLTGYVLGIKSPFVNFTIARVVEDSKSKIDQVKSEDFKHLITNSFGTIRIQASGKNQLEAEIDFQKKVGDAKVLRWRALGDPKIVVVNGNHEISQLMFRFQD
jgi:hypothetical protein